MENDGDSGGRHCFELSAGVERYGYCLSPPVWKNDHQLVSSPLWKPSQKGEKNVKNERM